MATDPSSLASIVDETLIRRNTALLVAPVHDELVMMMIESGRYYGLDDIGSDIWSRIENPCTFADLVDGLAADYDADRVVIADDVRKLLSAMAAHDVVTLSQGS